MSHLILQPAGHPEARSHYADTIEQPVSLERIRHHLMGDVLTELEQIYEGRGVPTWGVTPGQKGGNRNKWEKIVRGDVALFARAGEIFATAVVVIKAHCPELARELWGTDDNGQTWEYVYFLDEVQSCSIPYPTLNRCLDYKPNYVVRKFTVVEEEKSAVALKRLGLGTTTADTVEKVAVGAALDSDEKREAGRKGQGFSASPERRKAVEQRAMTVAKTHLEERGFDWEDTSANKPYDLIGTKAGEKIYIEVKGTSARGERVFLTKNEVAHAQSHPDECVLFILHDISVEETTPGEPKASGGIEKVIWPWTPQNNDLVALSFQYAVPEPT